ncbi:hypothetical protein [Helicobacter sp. 13S00477-4]|nr:hypothetical protein [Helicobacter sp. 13S00477-4]
MFEDSRGLKIDAFKTFGLDKNKKIVSKKSYEMKDFGSSVVVEAGVR